MLGRRPAPTAPRPLAQRRQGDPRPVALVSLLLAESAARDRVLAEARRFPRVRFIVVTDGPIAPFLAAGVVAEHLPAPNSIRCTAVAGDWVTYLRRRWRRLLDKWEPALLREEGVPFESYLEACGFLPLDGRTERS